MAIASLCIEPSCNVELNVSKGYCMYEDQNIRIDSKRLSEYYSESTNKAISYYP